MMESELKITVNGQPRHVQGIAAPAPLQAVLEKLELRPDRIAVELNGEIAPRTSWDKTTVAEGDRLEIVHFVGGGTALTVNPTVIGRSQKIEDWNI